MWVKIGENATKQGFYFTKWASGGERQRAKILNKHVIVVKLV